MNKNVAIIGASDKPDRYSYKALKLLQEHGYNVFPVHQRIILIDGVEVYPSIQDIKEEIDTVTLYVNSLISTSMIEDILSLNPRRIIFNPGTENEVLEAKSSERRIVTVRGCTLVMLKTNQF